MSRDWIDHEHDRRNFGMTRPLSQAEHAAVNARYPGCTVKRCQNCGEPIDDAQSVCSEECYDELHAGEDDAQ